MSNAIGNEYRQRWISLMEYLSSQTLAPDEGNRDLLTMDIEQILAGVPIGDTAYIGGSPSPSSFLRDFESIPLKPGDKDRILAAVGETFIGQPRWHHPHVAHNINPPSLIPAVAAGAVASLFNGNALWDLVSGSALEMERQIVRQMAHMVGWRDAPSGAFTFGGKGCLTYAIRLGLSRLNANIVTDGLSGRRAPVVLAGAANHYSIESVCALVGIGSANCLRVPNGRGGSIDLTEFSRTLDALYRENVPVAAIIVSGGNTLEFAIDELKNVHRIVSDLAEDRSLKSKPYIYYDTVVSWPWFFFFDYDFDANDLDIPNVELNKIAPAVELLRATSLADGFGIDFHKLGLCPISSSLFVNKDWREFSALFSGEAPEHQWLPHGNNFMQHHTIEHTRSTAPIISAWSSLQLVGSDGFRSYVAHGTSLASLFRRLLPQYGFELLNDDALGFASVFSPYPLDHEERYEDLLLESMEVIELHNFYTFKLFQYLSNGPENGISSIVLRFLPQYRIAKCGVNVAVIVVFPMSLSCSIACAERLAASIGAIKLQFDVLDLSSDADTGSIPRHVPK